MEQKPCRFCLSLEIHGLTNDCQKPLRETCFAVETEGRVAIPTKSGASALEWGFAYRRISAETVFRDAIDVCVIPEAWRPAAVSEVIHDGQESLLLVRMCTFYFKGLATGMEVLRE
ncbi:hypothetical protein M8R19_32115 [Pseudomonas sp. R3.Fl]|uniref:hypothetical protein n=1 Tax=Pseudomonas TaxID=286 RepID=UPI001080602D|nr:MULTISPECIES: hypothetical protein [Pseudomonas]MCL6693326.1 hypothetical protein [Pseudomonas sp. R3.Fl]UUC53190.1 hypothetical protein NOX82_15190 [Pseudomonas citronellolis]